MPDKMDQGKKKIIACDDNKSNLKSIQILLQDRYQVYPAASSEQLFKILDRIAGDLILLDVDMPGENGFQIIKRLKAKAELRDLPVIFLTGMTDGNSMLQGLVLGAVDYITKPIMGQLLLQRVELHLNLAAQKRELEQQTRELRAALEERTELEKSLEIILDKVPLACVLFDEHYHIKRSNTFAARIFGYGSPEEFTAHFTVLDEQGKEGGEGGNKVSYTINRDCLPYLKSAFDSGYSRFFYTYQSLSGSSLPMDNTALRIQIDHRAHLILYARDLREDIQTERTIEETYQRNIKKEMEKRSAPSPTKKSPEMIIIDDDEPEIIIFKDEEHG